MPPLECQTSPSQGVATGQKLAKSQNLDGLRWDDFVRNADIRDMVCQASGSMTSKRARKKWFRHVEKLSDKRKVKQVMRAEV